MLECQFDVFRGVWSGTRGVGCLAVLEDVWSRVANAMRHVECDNFSHTAKILSDPPSFAVSTISRPEVRRKHWEYLRTSPSGAQLERCNLQE